MSLYSKLDGIVKNYQGDILIIRDFVNSTYETLDNLSKVFDEHKSELTNEDAEALVAIAEALRQVADEGLRKKKPSGRTVPTTFRASQMIIKVIQAIKSKEFLAEMALSYIISFQEGFIKDYLELVFYNRSKLLISNKNLSYHDALSFNSISNLRRYLAKSETDILGYGGIDDLEAYFQKKFNISVQQEPFWPGVREASYRRNLIIHNRSVVNKVYREKIGSHISNSKLETDSKYVSNATDDIVSFMDFVHHSIANKLKLKKEARRPGEGITWKREPEEATQARPHARLDGS
jgi:hypothetical protein